MNKRVIALLLALMCAFSLFAAVPAYADEPETPPSVEETAEPTEPAETTEPEETAEPAETTEPTEPVETTEPTPEPTVTPEPGPWYRKAMEYAKENGLLKGDDKGNMNPEENATRAQIAAIITRVFGCTAEKSVAHFSDVDADAWYYHELAVAVSMGVMNGDAAFSHNYIILQIIFLCIYDIPSLLSFSR